MTYFVVAPDSVTLERIPSSVYLYDVVTPSATAPASQLRRSQVCVRLEPPPMRDIKEPLAS